MTIHVLALGQSNLANHCGSLGQSETGRALLNGEAHALADPVAGGTGTLGSVWPRVADGLAAEADELDFTLTLAASGGTSIEEWAPGGPCFAALEKRIAAGDCEGVTQVVFQQGEKDTLLETSQEDYTARFTALHAAVTEPLGPLPWVICRSSYRFSVTSDAVIAAQTALIDTLPLAIAGPALDGLGSDYRRDDTHFNDAGLDAFAQALVPCILTAQQTGER